MARTLKKLLAAQKPRVVKTAREKADEMLLNIHLAELRERVQLTQADIARALSIKQPSVAGMEKAGRDIKLSSLKRYVEAAGGRLNIDVELPDGSHFAFTV